MDLRGKKILITNYSISEYAGSELNCLELGILFKESGANVEIATLNLGEPIIKEFNRKRVNVKNILFESLDYDYYDIIWAQHYIVLDYLLFNKNIGADYIVCSSLSPFSGYEVLPIYANDVTICLANSKETYSQVIYEGVEREKLVIFPNSVSRSCFDLSAKTGYSSLNSVAIVSNHVPEELYKITSDFEKLGISYEVYGINYRFELINSKIIREYDAIITIGRTATLSIACGVPVYCYDIHGGPGWITNDNIEECFYYNLSGRPYGKKQTQTILNELINGYKNATENLLFCRNFIKTNCMLEENVEEVLNIIYSHDKVNIDEIKSKYSFIKRSNNLIIELYRQNREKELAIQYLKKDKSAYSYDAQRYLDELNNIYQSKAWKMINMYRSLKDNLLSRNKESDNKQISLATNINNINNINDKNQPLITVGIPVFDSAEMLIESIDSILNQTYPNVEIIVVTDGSPEDTVQIMRKYESEGKIRAFYYKDNSKNVARCMNKAIREASGEYFAFHDSNSIASLDRLSISKHYLEEYNADVVYGGWKDINTNNEEEVLPSECDETVLVKKCILCQSTVMTKTSILREVGGLKDSMLQRTYHELWLRLAHHKYKFKTIDKILVSQGIHDCDYDRTLMDNDDYWYKKMLQEYTQIIPMKPKVAYLIPGTSISGGIAVVCQHLNRLIRKGFDVLFITEDNSESIDWFPNQEVPIVPLKASPDNIDILVATGWSTAYTAETISAKKKYYFVQSDESRFFDDEDKIQLARNTYSMDYEFITEAKWIQKWLKEEFGKDAYYVPNGLDSELMFPTSERYTEKDGRLRVLLEGPIDIPFKGMEDAFMAVKDLDCDIWCVSSAGEPKPGWRCDKFFNRVDFSDMKYIYSSCDILLKMSRVEGFFGPPMEMMACKGACVVGEVTGYDEYIVDGYNALVVKQGDVEGARNAVKTLLENEDLRKTLVANGYKTAMEWDWDKSIDLLEDIYMNYR